MVYDKRLISIYIQFNILKLIMSFLPYFVKINSIKSNNERLSLLTLAPLSWNQEKTAEFFGVLKYAVAKSHELKKTGGILAQPSKNKRGYSLSVLRLLTAWIKRIINSKADIGSQDMPVENMYTNLLTRELHNIINQSASIRIVWRVESKWRLRISLNCYLIVQKFYRRRIFWI